ncbi:MAG: hypothetical protein E7588_10230 [Ruminococcaceae bacterium]|nr:hypothetical protein [Oscillospiraceae bacterium]
MTKIQKLILIALAVVIVVLGAVFAYVFTRVSAVKYTITATFEPYTWHDGVLINKDGTSAMRFIPNMGTYRELEIGIFDISQYDGAQGLETETVTAYVDSSNLIPMSGNALPYYNLDSSFIYGKTGEEKYLVNTETRTVIPLLGKSSANVEGVCTGGEFILECDGKNVTIHQRKDRTTNEIISIKEVEINEDFDSVEFVAWYNERYALLRLKSAISTKYAIADGATGECTLLVATNDIMPFISEVLKEEEDSPAEGLTQCYNRLISGKYLQFYDNVHDIMTDSYNQVPSGRYMDIFTGIRYDSGLHGDSFTGKNELVCVSADGTYCVFETALKSDPYRQIEYVIFNSENGKYYKLSEIVGNEVFIDDVFFVYNNVLFVNYAELNTGKEASCSIKLSF